MEDKIAAFYQIEGGEGQPGVCKAMNLPPPVGYSRSKLVEKMEKLISIWVEDMNQKTFLSLKQKFQTRQGVKRG